MHMKILPTFFLLAVLSVNSFSQMPVAPAAWERAQKPIMESLLCHNKINVNDSDVKTVLQLVTKANENGVPVFKVIPIQPFLVYGMQVLEVEFIVGSNDQAITALLSATETAADQALQAGVTVGEAKDDLLGFNMDSYITPHETDKNKSYLHCDIF